LTGLTSYQHFSDVAHKLELHWTWQPWRAEDLAHLPRQTFWSSSNPSLSRLCAIASFPRA